MECQKNLSHKTILIGVGFGECGILHAGGVFGRIEHFLIGKGITTALKALKHATPEQPMVLSQNLWRLVEKFFVWKQLMHNIHLPERTFDYVFGIPVKSSFNTIDLRTQVGERRIREIQAELKNYIPSSFRAYLKLKKDKYGSEHRRISMLIVNVEMTCDLETTQSFTIIQKLVKIIQQHAYRMEGSFNKIVSYDGGFAVICTWGLSPMSHTDDASRAVIAAITMKKKLTQFFQVVSGIQDFNPPVHMGICTGNIFMGIVGSSTEGNRKEIVMLGEIVERAFLFMQTATKVYGRIFCDQETRADANHMIDFEYLEHIQFSEKILNYPVFSPIDPILEHDYPSLDLKPSQILRQLRIHAHPFKLDFDNVYQHTFASIFGQTEVIPQIIEDIYEYLESPSDSVWTLCIRGKSGSGKSLFARCLLMEVIKKQAEMKKKSMVYEFIVTSSNPEIAKRFAGHWIPILRKMLTMICAQNRLSKEKYLQRIVENSPVCDKLDLIEDIFGLERNEIDRSLFPPQLLLKDLPHAFVMVKSFPSPIEDALINFMTDFIADVIDQFLSANILFFIVFDNLSLADQATWKLLEHITDCCSHLVIVACLQSGETGSSDQYKVSEHAKRHYQENQQLIDGQLFNVVEVEPLSALDVREIVIQTAEGYEREMSNEIELQTAIIDAQINKIKTEMTQQVIKRQLIQKYQVYNTFLELERELVEHVVQKCQGNPLWSLSLLHSLITNNLVFIQQQLLICQKRLRYCFITNCWNNLQLPSVIQKTHTQQLEGALMGNILVQKLPSDVILTTIMILKAASVIGPIFTLRQVQALVNLDQVEVQLEEMENRGILELLYDEATDKCYRFVHSLMREALLYQQLQEHQRVPCHQKIVAYLQENVVLTYQTKWDIHVEQTLLLQNLLDESRYFTENQLSYIKRQPLTLKKVNTAIFFKDKHIKASEVSRQFYNEPPQNNGPSQQKGSQQQKQKVYEQVFITLHEQIFCIYKDRLTYEYNQPAYLTIHLDQVSDVEVYKFSPPSSFAQKQEPSGKNLDDSAVSVNESGMVKKKQVLLLVECKQYYRGETLRDMQKEFVFVVDSRREAEEWMGSIEYLRTKASVRSFVEKFGGNVLLQLSDGVQQQMWVPGQQVNAQRFGETLQREVFEAPHAQNLFQIKLYQKLLTITNSKRIKQRLKEKLIVQNTSVIEQSSIEQQVDQSQRLSIFNLKDLLLGLYNVLNIHLYQKVTDNTLKLTQDPHLDEDDEEPDFLPPQQDTRLSHMSPKLQDFKERILLPFREMGIINDGGFTQILDKDDETHTRTFIEQQQSPDKLQEDESQVEEDDILDEEEYKRLIDRKGNYVRFSNLKDGLMIKGERRLTIFNPLDPNNAQQALRFLKLPLRRMATRKLSKAGKASPGGAQNEGEEISGESNLSQSLIQEEQSGVHIVDEPQDYIFAEYNRVKIGGIKGYRFQEGQDVMQVVSMLNDINEKHVNTKRRRKNMIATDHNEVHLQEEINPGAQQSITPSIAQQQKKHKNASKAKKAQALSKILEQASKKYKSQTVEETVEKRKKKKKRAPALPPVIQSDSNQGMLMQIDLQKHIIPETSESELEEEGPKINASNYHRVQSQHDLKMMSSCRSIGYLQTLHEAEKNNNEYRTRRDSSSRNQSVLSRRTFSKIYKPTPSMKKLPEWPDQSQIPMTSKIHKGSYPDDNFDLNDDTDNDESLFSKKSDPKILRETSPVPSENIETFKKDEILVVMIKNVQCIVQGHQSQIKLQQGDRLVVERDLKDFNLVQCTWKVEEKVLSVIVPRDALQRERDFNQPLPRADSALTNLKQVNSHHILQQQPPIYPSNFDASHQLTMMHDTFSQNNDASQDVTKPQNIMTPLQFAEQQSPIDANQRSLLKLKERRKRKEQQTMLSEISHGSQEPLRITGEATLQASAAEGQGVQLKAMARKMKKMLKVGFNE